MIGGGDWDNEIINAVVAKIEEQTGYDLSHRRREIAEKVQVPVGVFGKEILDAVRTKIEEILTAA